MRAIANDVAKPTGVDPGPAPMLQWIEIEKLRVDDRYQRDLKKGNRRSIARIAAEFKWSRFSPLFVAPIEGGLYAVIDGQHRVHAAASCGIAEVPCQIVQMDLAEQAASFAAVNGLVVKVTLTQIFKAALVAREPWAMRTEDACKAAGCRLMTHHGNVGLKKPGEIYSLGLVRDLVNAGRDELVVLGLSALRKSEFGSAPTSWEPDVLKPWLTAVTERPRLKDKIVELTEMLDAFDFFAAIDNANDFVRAKKRQGVFDISRWDIITANVGEAIDKAFPQTMQLPAPKREAAE